MNIQTDSTKVTFIQVYNDVKEGLQGLGDALKVGAEHVYQILVRQQVVEAWTWLILGVLSGIIIFIGVRLTLSSDFESKNNRYGYKSSVLKDEHIVKFILGILFILVGGISGVTCICHVNDIITGFTNPEYGAMKEIMEFVK